jgi:hypothetical protein
VLAAVVLAANVAWAALRGRSALALLLVLEATAASVLFILSIIVVASAFDLSGV